MKEQHLLEREQLFALERLLAQKLSTKTEQLLSVRLMKQERKFQGTYEVSGDPACKSVNSYEEEAKEVALAILFELFIDPVAAQTCFKNTSGARNSKINQTDKENRQVDENDCEELKLCKVEHGAQATYEAEQTRLRLNDVQLGDSRWALQCPSHETFGIEVEKNWWNYSGNTLWSIMWSSKRMEKSCPCFGSSWLDKWPSGRKELNIARKML